MKKKVLHIVEAFGGGVFTYLTALANNILRVAKDTKLRERISLNGYNTVKNMSWEKQVDKFIEILQNEW